MPIDPEMRPFLQSFSREEEEIHATCARVIVELERASADQAKDLVTKLARGVHTLKGSAATLGLDDVAAAAHALEELLAPAKKRGEPLTSETCDRLLHGLDLLHARVVAYVEGRDGEPSGLEGLLGAAAAVSSDGGPRIEPVAPPPAPPAMVGSADGQEELLLLKVPARQVSMLLKELERLRELRGHLDERRRSGLRELARIEGGRAGTHAESLRSSLAAITHGLGRDVAEADGLLEVMEEGLKAISTLPIQAIVDPLHRSVRDLSRQLGKEARLSLVGGSLSVDRNVLEALRGPLMHLVRNALDHGIEMPHVRERRGKHRVGEIVVRAVQQGNVITLEVSDDGEGISHEVVRETAERRGLASAEKLVGMPEAELLQLVFRPGFSTRREITDVSGRGVGLDVVQEEVRRLQAQLELKTSPGAGTRFILTVPVGYGSSPVVLVRCGEFHFAVPSNGVEMMVSTGPRSLVLGTSGADLRYRDELVSVTDLGGLLQIREPLPVGERQKLLVVHCNGRRSAYLVDEIDGERDLVLRPLPPALRDLPAYRGLVTTAEGDLALVLRPEWLVGAVRSEQASARRRALVVDDSLTARALHRNALEAGGFAVHTASSAEQALQLLGRTHYDVLICDIAMEGMDGIALTRTVRGRPAVERVPVVLVSSRDDEEMRASGHQAGADGFVSKRDCTAGRLLAEVRKVLGPREAQA